MRITITNKTNSKHSIDLVQGDDVLMPYESKTFDINQIPSRELKRLDKFCDIKPIETVASQPRPTVKTEKKEEGASK